MTYQFKSDQTGDVLMLQAPAEQVLRIIGRTPAASGIIEPAALASAIRSIEAAVEEEDRRLAEAASPLPQDASPAGEPAVTLRQRTWPLLEMLRAANAAAVAVVWGV